MLLKKGSSGLQVQAIQAFLKRRVTGIFDDDTVDAVREYQLSNGLVGDGMVGANTRKAMFGTPISKLKEATKGLVAPKVRGNWRGTKISGVSNDKLVKILSTQFESSERTLEILRYGIEHLKIHGHKYGITTLADLAYLMGQIKQEVGYNFNIVENLYYSAKALKATFSYYREHPEEAFKDGYSKGKKANVVDIANKAYANRYLNGSPESGDGWKFRGMGAIQTTFRYNVRQLDYWAIKLGIPNRPNFESFPDRRTQLKYVMVTAFIYWKQMECAKVIKGDLIIRDLKIAKISRIVNRYTKSLPQRKKYTKQFSKLLGVRYV